MSDAEGLLDHGHFELAGEDSADRHSVEQDLDSLVAVTGFADTLHDFRVQPWCLFVCHVAHLLSGFRRWFHPIAYPKTCFY